MHTSLKLIGIVVPHVNQQLVIRNRIYENTFTQSWAKEVIPINWSRNIALFSIIALLLVGFVIYFELLLPKQYINAIRSALDDVPTEQYYKLQKIPFYKASADSLLADYWQYRAPASNRSTETDWCSRSVSR